MNPSGAVTAVNTFGATGLISRTIEGATPTSTFYTFDEAGSVAERTDATGTVTYGDVFGAFGTVDSTSDPFGYGAQAGYYTDHETGLILCTSRYYDPATARWLTRDPIGYPGGTNLYAYCENGPVGAVDPSGLWDVPGCEQNDGVVDPAVCEEEKGGGIPAFGDEGAGINNQPSSPPGMPGPEVQPERVGTGYSGAPGGSETAAEVSRSEVATPVAPPGNEGHNTCPDSGGGWELNGPCPPDEDFVDLTSPARRTHILEGDVTGGGHGMGRGISGKSEFTVPDDEAIHQISDVATDPYIPWKSAGSSGGLPRFSAEGNGVKVIIEPGGEGIITGYPTNVPRNP